MREEGGVAVFDTGHKPMGKAVRAAADALGGATRIVLGNPHADHRGGAKAIGAPVHCHVDDRENVEGDGAAHDFDFGLLPAFSRAVTKKTFAAWDGGPLPVAGDARRGRSRRRLRGRPPARPLARPIALWRASDRLAITNDCFALFHPALPVPGQAPARAALRRSTGRPSAARRRSPSSPALEPATCWPAHYGPVTGDVAAKLRAAI